MLGDEHTHWQVLYLQPIQHKSLAGMVDIETHYLAMLVEIDDYTRRDFDRINTCPLTRLYIQAVGFWIIK